ncbi:DNA helicase MCM9-like isoform X3 [Sipha flava]|uniref:DNA helicase MCM9 n=1 Tax=Sipha flava TaxID=143950 RepID=A0A8B8GE21_9HEMI|nr:DNA helicase MCM9-like isoform X2 [Sipha flava]XP_025421480.1 DNA helicase MCM9-like isoform X3 [Sipha flava]
MYIFSFLTLFEKNPKLGEEILEDSINVLEQCDKNLISAQRVLKKNHHDKTIKLRIKKKVHTRITALPLCPELHRTIFPRNEDIGSFLRVNGTVVRTVLPKLLEYKRIYYCNKCKEQFDIKIDYEQYNKLVIPFRCPNPDNCSGTNLKPLKDEKQYIKDYQEIKIQEQIGKTGLGAMPRSMWVSLEDDLVDTCKPGDDVIICGTVIRRWSPTVENAYIDIELCLRANHLIVCNDQQSAIMITKEWIQEFEKYWEDNKNDPFAARDQIIASISPQTYGLYTAKLAVALGLAGGVQRQASQGGGIKIRGETHLLLIGDPGTGKSQLLKFAWKVCPRSIFTTGVGSSRAGLTVAAFREGSEWHLEAGALVLADGGICCVDEFGSLKEDDRTAIHEAMEQQSISVAKAGLVCKLDTRCTVMAAMNPKSKYNLNLSITDNIKVASPLLSRFDLILILIDTKNEDWEKVVSSYVLQGKKPGANKSSSTLWNLEKLQHYFCTIRNMTPETTEDANIILSKYYWMQRQSTYRNAARTTVRFLESLLRLSQAHAKLMFRNHVLVQDAIVAISLMECSNDDGSPDSINTLYTKFPICPKESYIIEMKKILKKLDLEDILEKEINLWSQKSKINSTNTIIDDLKMSDVQSKNLNNILTSKISETIQNIKIKKQKDFYTSQIHRREIKKPKTASSKNEKEFPELFQQDGIDVILNEEDIFVNKSVEKSNISVSLSTSSSMSLTSPILSLSNSSDSCINERNSVIHPPLLTPSDTRKLARMKLSAFRCNKSNSNSNSDRIEPDISASPTPQSKLNLPNIFSTGDEDDLSYLDID